MENNKEQYVSYETALLAKELGFDWECREYYNSSQELKTLSYYEGGGNGYDKNSTFAENYYFPDSDCICVVPTQSVLQRWLREFFYMDIIPPLPFSNKNGWQYACTVIKLPNTSFYATYEHALENELFERLTELKNAKNTN